jgi:hypothetical protein
MKKWTVTTAGHDRVETAADFDEAYRLAISWLPPHWVGKIHIDEDNKLITVEV